jgi:hypothetical protein
MRRRDVIGLTAAVVTTAIVILYRLYILEPRAWGAVCAQAARPAACLPRAGLIWLQGEYLLGSLPLAFGIWGLAYGGGYPAQLAAVLIGIVGIENYNATWAAAGLALGAWGWMRRDGWRARQPA